MKYKALIFLLLFSINGSIALADLENSPTLSDLGTFIINTVRLLLGASIIVLVGIIAFGAWKAAVAFGDPKGLQGAKQTWTYAVYGFLVIVLAFSFTGIIARAFGISDSIFDISNIVSKMNSSMTDLFGSIVGTVDLQDELTEEDCPTDGTPCAL